MLLSIYIVDALRGMFIPKLFAFQMREICGREGFNYWTITWLCNQLILQRDWDQSWWVDLVLEAIMTVMQMFWVGWRWLFYLNLWSGLLLLQDCNWVPHLSYNSPNNVDFGTIKNERPTTSREPCRLIIWKLSSLWLRSLSIAWDCIIALVGLFCYAVL